MDGPETIALALTRAEALVLMDFLARTDRAQGFEPLVVDQAELRALWDLAALLEKALPDVVAPDYVARVAAARQAIRDNDSN